MLQSVAKIPLLMTFSGVAEIDFVDFGNKADLIHMVETCKGYSTIASHLGSKERRTNCE